jgi:hypothetical protein
MLPFIIYFVAAIVTGIHLLTLLSLAAYGVTISPFELLALLGSILILIAAYVSLFRPYAAARIALLAAILMWSFYGPAIATYVRGRLAKRSVLSEVTLPSGWPEARKTIEIRYRSEFQ